VHRHTSDGQLARISHTIFARSISSADDFLALSTVVLRRGAWRRDQGWDFSGAAAAAKKGVSVGLRMMPRW
jgi:hypothetical protein